MYFLSIFRQLNGSSETQHLVRQYPSFVQISMLLYQSFNLAFALERNATVCSYCNQILAPNQIILGNISWNDVNLVPVCNTWKRADTHQHILQKCLNLPVHAKGYNSSRCKLRGFMVGSIHYNYDNLNFCLAFPFVSRGRKCPSCTV